MFFILSKVLVFLIQTLSWIFVLIVLAFLLKKGRYKRQLLISAGVSLFFFSNVFIVDEFYRAWEIETLEDKDIKHHKTAIVLGGMTGWDAKLKRIQFFNSSDRLMQTLRIYKEGKLDQFIITSGSGKIDEPEAKEANFIHDYLQQIDVLDSNMYIENQSRNTHENAAYCKPLLDKIQNGDTVLLVTSAFHMRRASACFNAVGIPHHCFSTDRGCGPRRFSWDLLLIPNVEALGKWNVLFKEWVGMASYWVKGWV